MSKFIMITGGCGYIGSHITQYLQKKAYQILVVDNLSTGYKNNFVEGVAYEIGDINDTIFMEKIFNNYPIDSIIHLAAKTSVEESMREVSSYYQENLLATIQLMKLAGQYHVKRFLFSSTAAVYGENSSISAIEESAKPHPSSVYGKSKYFAELALRDMSQEYGIQCLVFRYFNVAGNDPSLSVGNYNKQASALVQKIARNITANNYHVDVYGNDYPTKDGSCVRDFIHVMDIAQAHYLGLQLLSEESGHYFDIFNIGYGNGISVLEMIALFKKIIAKELSYDISKPREGDIAFSVADNKKIRQKLAWNSLYEDPYTAMIESELAWCGKLFS